MDEKQRAKIKFTAILISVLLILATIVGLVIWYMQNTKKDVPDTKYNDIIENTVKNEIADNTVQPGDSAENAVKGNKYKIWINNNGTVSIKIDSDIKIWEDELSLSAENEEEKIAALKRKIIMENVVQTRTLEIKNKKIVKIFALDKFNNDISYEARAVVKCDDKTYYLVDLIGKSTLAKYPVVIQELTKIEDKEIQTFIAKSDTAVQADMTILNYDAVFAKVNEIENIEVYDSRDLITIADLIKEKYSNDENIEEIAISEIKVENIVGKLNDDDILEGDYLVFTANYSIKYKVYNDIIGELVGIKDKKQINECIVEGYAKKEEDKYEIKEFEVKNTLNLIDTLSFTEVSEYAYNVVKAYFQKHYPEEKIIKDINGIVEARYFNDIIVLKLKFTEKSIGGLYEEVTKSGYILKDSNGAYTDVYVD